MNNSLSDKIIIVTGGSSRLGKAIVQKALKLGAKVLFTYYKHSLDAQALIEQGGEGFSVNLACREEIEKFAETIHRKIKTLDILIHNAAATRDNKILSLSEEDWEYVMNVNLKAPYFLTQKLLPLFGEREKEKIKKIFFISSRTALDGGEGIANYAASKAGLLGLTKSLAQELGERNILVNALNPGFMESRMTEKALPEIKENHLKLSPLRQYSDPEEVAAFLIYLCSDQVKQVTGQFLHYDSRRI